MTEMPDDESRKPRLKWRGCVTFCNRSMGEPALMPMQFRLGAKGSQVGAGVGRLILELFVYWRIYLSALLAVSLLLPGQVLAGGLVFSQAWARATVNNAGAAAIYGLFDNQGNQPLTIRGITTDVAGKAMLHHSTLEDGMIRMLAVDELTVAPGEIVELKPGGLHIMLTELRQSLDETDLFYISIVTRQGKRTRAEVRVGSIGQMSAPQ